jgi:hypothetical protein
MSISDGVDGVEVEVEVKVVGWVEVGVKLYR